MFGFNGTNIGLGITTPKEMNEEVKKFCAKISSREAIFLEVASLKVKNARPLFCYENVEEAIKKHGGCEQLGWTIWIDPENRFIKAEAHSVFNSNDKIVDVTPQLDGEAKILFLPDDKLVNTGRVIPSVYEAFVSDENILNYIKEEEEQEVEYGKFYDIQREQMKSLKNPLKFLKEQTKKSKKKIGRNEPCPCGSGLKYKKCCLNKN